MAWLVHPFMWTDEDFIELSEDAQHVFCYLLTGARSKLPGLIRSSPEMLSSQLKSRGKHWEVARVRAALDELGRERCDGRPPMVEYDGRELLRLAQAPKHNLVSNPKQLLGWYREWRDLPRSPLKYEHLRTLIHVCREDGKGVAELWAQTFGPILDLLEQHGTRLRTQEEARAFETVCITVGLNLSMGSGSGSGNGKGSGSTRFPNRLGSTATPQNSSGSRERENGANFDGKNDPTENHSTAPRRPRGRPRKAQGSSSGSGGSSKFAEIEVSDDFDELPPELR